MSSEATASQKNTVHIDFAAIREIAYKGVRRAAVFLGLRINASESPELKDYKLIHHSPYLFLPADVDGATLGDRKEEFGSWIVTCGLRELMETFAVFLDKIHEVCLLMAVSKGQIDKTEVEDYARSFPHKGLKDKLSTMANRFSVAPDHPEALSSINQSRNCLAHRRGVVGPEDCNDGDELSVRWWPMQLYFEAPEGERMVVDLPITRPVEGPTGASLKIGRAEQVRSFPRGTVAKCSPKELYEICLFLQFSADHVTTSAGRYADKLGIPSQPATTDAPSNEA